MRTRGRARRSRRALAGRSAFVTTVAFYGAVALPLARRELAGWRRRARAIADPTLRALAVATLRQEHVNSEGAAAFAVLHPRATRQLVPLLVAYQLTWDFVDTLLEQPGLPPEQARSICGALELALGFDRGDRTNTDRVRRDGGDFLADLVDACRDGCARLPRYAEARPVLRRVVGRADALLVANGPPEGRLEALHEWTARHEFERRGLEPAELCAAAQCSLGVHAILAAAGRLSSRTGDFEAIDAAYFPWVDALCTLLDSVVDQRDDVRTGDFSFVDQYASPADAARRLGAIAGRALQATRTLPAGHRHAALVSAVVGMYVSAPASREPQARTVARAVLEATAPLSTWAAAVMEIQRRMLA